MSFANDILIKAGIISRPTPTPAPIKKKRAEPAKFKPILPGQGRERWTTEEDAKKLEAGTYTSKTKSIPKYKKSNKKKQKKSENKPIKNNPSSETQKFLSEYVYNDEDFDKTMIGYHINRMIHYKNVDWDVIQEKLLRLEHKDFCVTNYWKYISAYQVIKHNHHCNRCPSETMLQTHHKTYLHKGREIFFMEQDLEVLCRNCHRQEHGL